MLGFKVDRLPSMKAKVYEAGRMHSCTKAEISEILGHPSGCTHVQL